MRGSSLSWFKGDKYRCRGFFLSSSYFFSWNTCFVRNITLKRHFSISNSHFYRDPYEVLQVPRTATEKEIKSAYIKLVKKYHPDNNKSPDASSNFQEIKEAYERIRNGEANQSSGKGRDYYSSTNQDFSNTSSDFGSWFSQNDIFSDLFGRKSNFGSARKIVYQTNLGVSFMDAALGRTVNVSIGVEDVCTRCSGKRYDPDKGSHSKCHTCKGQGYNVHKKDNASVQMPCRSCSGLGYIIHAYCKLCRGSGVIDVKKSVNIHIPSGSSSGDIIKEEFDRKIVEFVLTVHESGEFKKIGLDIHSDITISFMQALTGCSVLTSTIHGPKQVNISPGTSSHEAVTLPNSGIRQKRGMSGSHVFHIKIKVPRSISSDKLEILKGIFVDNVTQKN